MKIFGALMAVLLSASFASAGGVGNGGFVIQCNDKTELLDYFLMRQSGQTISPIPGIDFLSKTESLLSRLEKLDPNRAKNFRNQFQFLQYGLTDGRFMKSGNVLKLNSTQVADPNLQKAFGLGNLQIPNNCQLILAAEHASTYPNSNDSTQHLNSALAIQIGIYYPVWNSLDDETKAGILLHELFYMEFVLRQTAQPISPNVRVLNGVLASDQYIKMATSDWSNLLTHNRLSPMFPNFALPVETWDLTFGWSSGLDNTSNYNLLNSLFDGTSSEDDYAGTGVIEICGRTYQVDAYGAGNVFWEGIVPWRSSFSEKTVVDLSCYSGLTALTMNYDKFSNGRTSADVKYGCGSVGTSAEFCSGASATPQLVGLPPSQTFIYQNPNVKTLGPVSAQLDPVSKRLLISTDGEQFASVEVLKAGNWKMVNSCTVDLATGKIIGTN